MDSHQTKGGEEGQAGQRGQQDQILQHLEPQWGIEAILGAPKSQWKVSESDKIRWTVL